MADMQQKHFSDRVQRIEKGHRNLNSGYVTLVERNGVLVPVRKVRPRRGFPWRGLFLVLIVFLLFKAFLLAYLGPITYIDQHAKLEAGGIVEQAGRIGEDALAQPVIGGCVVCHLGASGLSQRPEHNSGCGAMRPGVARMRRGAARTSHRPAKAITRSSGRSRPSP